MMLTSHNYKLNYKLNYTVAILQIEIDIKSTINVAKSNLHVGQKVIVGVVQSDPMLEV